MGDQTLTAEQRFASNSYQIRGGPSTLIIVQGSLSCPNLLLRRSNCCVIDLDKDGEV
jgi:hypothetical protein